MTCCFALTTAQRVTANVQQIAMWQCSALPSLIYVVFILVVYSQASSHNSDLRSLPIVQLRSINLALL